MSTEKKLTQLWKKYKKCHDLKSKNELVEHYYFLVEKISANLERSFKYKISRYELASHGVDGLYKAIERFDLDREIKFETYASQRISGSMIDGLRSEDWVPRSVRLRYSAINREKEILETKSGSKIDDTEAAKHAGFCEKDFMKNKKKFIPISLSSIEECSSELGINDSKKDFNIFLKSTSVSSPDSKILRKEFFNKLLGKNFSQREREIIYYYYYEELSMGEIAEKLELSESRVSQMLKKLISKLKLRAELNPNYFKKDILSIIEECNDRDSLF
jgi:RNA polymerase sigma factor for flagellar operon FliA